MIQYVLQYTFRLQVVIAMCVAVPCMVCPVAAQTTEVIELTGPEPRRVSESIADSLRLASPLEPTRKLDSASAEMLRLDFRDNHIMAFSTTGPVVVTIVDARGGEFGQKSDERGQLALDVHALPSGMYLVTAVSDGRRRLLTVTR